MDEPFNTHPSVVNPSQDSKNIALLMWLGTIFFGFIPALVIYLIKTEDSYLADQSKEALNWMITLFIASAVSWVLCLVLIGFLLLGALWVINLVFCILGVIATSSGQHFRVPFAFRFIK